MERKKIVLLCLVAIMTLCLNSCGGSGKDNGDQGDGDTCMHTFSSKWSADAIQHWHAVTCEHTSLKSDVDSHTDSDEDGACDVCAYEIGHEHTYSEAWQSDATHHWRKSTCSHKGEKTDFALHNDSDSDASCDSCGTHVHLTNVFGKCVSCGEQLDDVDVSDFDTIIPLIVSNSGKIASGTVSHRYYSSTPSTPGSISNEMSLSYRLGDGSAYYLASSRSNNYGYVASDTQESWYHLVDGNEVFGVYKLTVGDDESELMLDGAASPNKLVGYYYSVSTLANAHGAENLLLELYKLAKSDNASGFTSAYASGVYTFSFNYLYVNFDTGEGEPPHTDYYEVKCSFTVSDSGALTSLNVLCDCYGNSLESELDKDFDYDQATNTITMRDGARPDTYSFVVTQEEGKRDYVSEYQKSDFIPEDFEIFTDPDCTDKITDTVTTTVGKVFHLYLGSFAPEGTSIKFVADSFTVFCPYNDVICMSNAISSSIIVNVKAAGTYTLIVTVGDIVKEITVTAVVSTPDPIDPTPVPDNALAVQTTDNNVWDKDFVTFVAPADGDYTFTVPAGSYVGAWADGDEQPFADFNVVDKLTNQPIGGTKTVTLKEGETYKIFVSSPEKNTTVYIYHGLFEDSGDSGDDTDPVVPTVKPITVGTHTVTVTESDIASESISYTLEVTEDGTYTFIADGMFANFYSAQGVLLSRDHAYLVSGSYTVSIYLGGLTEQGEYTFTLSYTAPAPDPTPDPEPDPDPTPDTNLTGLEGTFIAHTVYGSNVRVVVDSTAIYIVDPEGRILTFTYTYVDDVFEVYYKGNKLPNVRDPKFTITDGVLTEICNNGNYYTLEPTDEVVSVGGSTTPDITVEPDGTEQHPFILETLPESITFTSNTQNKTFYVFTAEQSGTLTITWPSADSWGSIFEINADGGNTGNDSSAYLTTTVTLEVTEGCTYKIGLGTWNNAGEVTVTLSID